ncbi:MAG TPA: hypothetical protein DEQ38_14275 [Elusimicrobia bacterium]|nr:MAG: hypothetical protein A2089_07015 [Elusimicrobia bacterium GWD2_63_28]HCC49263.1 hypothetical protein [Elusimicrobiota bacterium]
MPDIWKFFSGFEFLGGLLQVTVGGISLYSLYGALLFWGFWGCLIYSLAARPKEALSKLFQGPTAWLALAVAAAFFFLNNNDLGSAYTYEVQNLAGALTAADAGDLSPLLRQDRVMPLFFGVILYFSGLQALTAVLCLFIGLFYALWERILREVFGFRQGLTVLLALLTALLQLKLRYFFSAYFIFALFFSALFLYNLLRLLKDGAKEQSFFRLAQPVGLILLASLFRQESVTLFPVYFTGLLFLDRASFKKGAVLLAAGCVLYLPFLYRDWTREESQFMSREWDQGVAELFYDSAPRAIPRELFSTHQHLASAAFTIRHGRLFGSLDRQEFVDAVKTVNETPAPSLANVWYNLKYRSTPFLLFTAAWFAFFLAALRGRRRLGRAGGCLAALAVYILSLFFIFHLSSLATEIWVSYCHLLPAYLAFCLLAAKTLYKKAGTA